MEFFGAGRGAAGRRKACGVCGGLWAKTSVDSSSSAVIHTRSPSIGSDYFVIAAYIYLVHYIRTNVQ